MPSGPIYESNLVAKRLAIPDDVFNVEADKTPIYSMLPKTTVEAAMLGSVVLEKFPNVASTGIIDGTAVTTVSYVGRETASVCAQHFRRPWGVSTLAELTSTYGVKDETGHQRAWAMMIVRRMIEQQIGSTDNSAEQSGGTPWTTRGILAWLQTSAHTTHAIPSDFVPASGTRYTGSMKAASFTDSELSALMKAASDAKKGPVDLDLFVGSSAKAVISEMTQADPYRLDGLDTVKNKVMVIDTDGGIARVHISHFVAVDTSTGAATAYSPFSGFGIDRSQWAWEWVKGKAPANTNLPADGSGDRGFVDAVGRLWSKNPLGQISIYTNTNA